MIIEYPVKPKPAPRPRVTKFGAYNDKDYTSWKNGLKLLAKSKIKQPLEGAIEINIEFLYSIPKSWSKKDKENANYHTFKPDIDNLIKSVLDGLNGIAYKDDSQVCKIEAIKRYGDKDSVIIKLKNILLN